MLIRPKTKKVSILGGEPKANVFGEYFLYQWDSSYWGDSSLFPYGNHFVNCVLSAYNVEENILNNIIDNDLDTFCVLDGPLFVAFRDIRKLYGIGVKSDNMFFTLYGSANIYTGDDFYYSFLCDNLDNGIFTNTIWEDNKIKLNSNFGEWISPVYQLDHIPLNYFTFNYNGNIPDNCQVYFEFRTSYDGLNWSNWKSIYKQIASTAKIKESIDIYCVVNGVTSIYPKVVIANENLYEKGNVKIYGIATGEDFYRYKVQIASSLTEQWVNVTEWIETPVNGEELCEIDTSDYEDGTYILKLIVENIVGMESIDTYVMVIDNSAPNVSIEFNQKVSGICDLLASIYDSNLKEWQLYIHPTEVVENLIFTGTENIENKIPSINFTTIDDGTYYVTIIAYDLSGNKTFITKSIVIDSSYPVIQKVNISNTVYSPNRHGDLNVDVTLNQKEVGVLSISVIKVENDIALQIKKLYEGEPSDYTIPVSWDGKNSEGEYIEAGNYFINCSFSITPDTNYYLEVFEYNNEESVFVITSPTENEDTSNFIEIEGSIIDDYLEKYEIYILENGNWILNFTGTDIVNESYIGAIYFNSDGANTFKIVVYDIWGYTREKIINVNVATLPTAELFIKNKIYQIIDCDCEILPLDIEEEMVYNEIVCVVTIQENYELPLSFVSAKEYIQIKAVLSRPDSEDLYINFLSIDYSDEWFLVARNVYVNEIYNELLYSNSFCILGFDCGSDRKIFEIDGMFLV